MIFVVKICDESGFELSRHEQHAEPYYSPILDTLTFELDACRFTIARRTYEEMMTVLHQQQYTYNEEKGK